MVASAPEIIDRYVGHLNSAIQAGTAETAMFLRIYSRGSSEQVERSDDRHHNDVLSLDVS